MKKTFLLARLVVTCIAALTFNSGSALASDTEPWRIANDPGPLRIVSDPERLRIVSDPTADIALIGDSHTVGCFGKRLDMLLRGATLRPSDRKAQVRTVASCGSSPSGWSSAAGPSSSCGTRSCPVEGRCDVRGGGSRVVLPSLAQVMMSSQAKVAIIALGTNMLPSSVVNYPKNVRVSEVKLANQMQTVRTLIAQVISRGRRCIWIGPPQTRHGGLIDAAGFTTFNRRLEHEVEAAGCAFIDSSDKTSRADLSADGIHVSCHSNPANSAGDRWAEKVFRALIL